MSNAKIGLFYTCGWRIVNQAAIVISNSPLHYNFQDPEVGRPRVKFEPGIMIETACPNIMAEFIDE